MATDLPYAKTEDQIKLWNKFEPVLRVAASDSYKRTMSASSKTFSENQSVYTMAARRSLDEPGANGRLVMAGLEKMLYSWFMNPIEKSEIERVGEFFEKNGVSKKFPHEAWQAVIDNDGYFPVDVYSLPGGQTFLVKDGLHVPILSVEGPGALATHLEPHFENQSALIIYATKAMLFREAIDQLSEFGLRSSFSLNDHVLRSLALYIGGGFTATSDDQAVFLFPELLKDSGTFGHEFPMSYQRREIGLEDAQENAFRDFIKANDHSVLLPDVISTELSGIPMIYKLAKEFGSLKEIEPRFDSGDISRQGIIWRAKANDLPLTSHIATGDLNPTTYREIKITYETERNDPKDIKIGVGGYFEEGNTRSAISLAYKRSATMYDGVFEPQMKFSDTRGKESFPGVPRIYARGRDLIPAQLGEEIDGTLLTQKVVSMGHIVYNESLRTQMERAFETRNLYDRIVYSPKTQEIIERMTAQRDAILQRRLGK